jgi:hypothetical protein
MSLTPIIYGPFLTSLATAGVNFNVDSFKAMLVGSGYTPNQNTHQYKSSVNFEVSGSGYVAGGMGISGVLLTYDSVNKRLQVGASPLVWANVTIAAIRYCVVYDDTPIADAAKPLICYIDFGTDQAPSDQSFYVTWPTTGMLNLVLP